MFNHIRICHHNVFIESHMWFRVQCKYILMNRGSDMRVGLMKVNQINKEQLICCHHLELHARRQVVKASNNCFRLNYFSGLASVKVCALKRQVFSRIFSNFHTLKPIYLFVMECKMLLFDFLCESKVKHFGGLNFSFHWLHEYFIGSSQINWEYMSHMRIYQCQIGWHM